MPIRFRCQHCHQLMGIARRKAGSEVQCPTCRHSVVVPPEDEVPDAPQPRAVAKSAEQASATGAAPLFERSDFDDVLRGPEAQPSPRIARPVPKNGASAPRGLESAPAIGAPASLPSAMIPSSGIFLSSNRATILAVAGIILLAVAFGAGLLVGRYLL